MNELRIPVPRAIRRAELSLKARRDERTYKTEQNKALKCPKCGALATRSEWSAGFYACPSCGAYQPIGGYYRLKLILDEGSFTELEETESENVLDFPGYGEKLSASQEKTGLHDAVVTATGTIEGISVVVCVLDSRFMMGSMGTAVGESVTRAIEYAKVSRCPIIIFSASGGARMQEGIFSLMQMAKTSAAIADFNASGGLYISYLTHPTTGGVTASFASLGDIMLAEPGALIGFAGPRVIEQTIGEKLPAGFQSSEAQEANGFVDQIVPRSEMRATLARLLRLHSNGVKRA